MGAGLVEILSAGVGASVAGGLGAVGRRQLAAQRHRRGEEVGPRPVRTWWVVPVCGALGALLGAVWASRPVLLAVLVVAVPVLVVLAAVDLDVRRLPDRLTRPAVVGSVLLLGLVALVEGGQAAWVRAVLAGAALFVFYLVLVLAAPGGMGFGDAKLAPTLGMLLGYLSWSHVVLGTMLAFVSGAVVALGLLATGAGRRARLAFGPHMVGAALLVLAVPSLTG